tara:strand:+ start:1135 stop:1356 length:222 start_codon:yes stop_codon:yes gene_type:complete
MKTLSNPIGYQFTLSWYGAKLCSEESVAGEQVRIEAIGSDWIIVRTEEGDVLANTYPSDTHNDVLDMIKELEE